MTARLIGEGISGIAGLISLVGCLEDQLDADEGEDDRQAPCQVVEAVQQARQHEVQRPQAEDGERVAGVDDEGVVADGEDGGHAVDGEDQVGGLDRGDHREQRRGDPLAGLLDEELRAGVLVPDRA